VRRAHRSAHAAVWAALAVLLPAILAAAFLLRAVDAPQPLSVRIAPPAADGGAAR
jgi:hypothetical protein